MIDDGYQRRQPYIFTAFRIGAIVALVAQTITLTTWLVGMHYDVQNLKAQQITQDRVVARLDETGSRAVAPLLAQIAELSAQINRIDISGGRSDIKTEAEIKALQGNLASLKAVIDECTTIIQQFRESLSAYLVVLQRLKRMDDDLAWVHRELERQRNDITSLQIKFGGGKQTSPP